MNTQLSLAAALGVLLSSGVYGSPPEGAASNGKFTRFEENETGARLQTGIGSYRNKDGVIVDLIGAIHIADMAYYQKLNERFKRYDVLLYEMVGESYQKRMKAKHEDTGALSSDERSERSQESKASGKLAWLHPLYDTMEKSLGLAGQMKGIDYSRENFVHADMTAREFSEMQQKKNESFLKLWWKSVVAQMEHPEAVPEQPGLLKIMEALCRKDGSVELRRAAARTFGSMEGVLAGLESEDGTVILTERNKVALGVLQQQLEQGRKHLAVFYGAAHLADMEKRLLAMGFERIGGEWFTAWDIPAEQKPGVDQR